MFLCIFIHQTQETIPWLVVEPTRLKTMLVILDSIFPRVRGENEKYLSCHQVDTFLSSSLHPHLPWHRWFRTSPVSASKPPAASEEGFEDVAGITSITTIQAFFTSVFSFIGPGWVTKYRWVAGKTKWVLRLNPPETCKKRPFWIGLCSYVYIPLKVWKHVAFWRQSHGGVMVRMMFRISIGWLF